jgi:autotransporter-associated beta strand protein
MMITLNSILAPAAILLSVLSSVPAFASITLTNTDGAGSPAAAQSFNVKGNWNDSLAPHSGTNYSTGIYTLRWASTSGTSPFQGDSLSVEPGGVFALKNTNVVTVNNLILNGGQIGQFLAGVNPDRMRVAGNITLATGTQSSIDTTGSGNRQIDFLAPVTGSGDLVTSTRAASANNSVVFLSVSNNFGGGKLTANGYVVVNDLNALQGLGSLAITNSGQINATLSGTYPSVATYISSAGTGLNPLGGLLLAGTSGTTWPGALISLNNAATVNATSPVDVTNTLAGPLGGPNTLTLRGHAPSGSVQEYYVLTGVSTNTGGLVILSTNSANVTVQLSGGDNRLSPLSSVTLRAASGLTSSLDLNGNNQQIAGLASTGAGANQVVSSTGGPVTLTISNSSDSAFAGQLGPNGETITVVKTGSGSQVFTGVGPLAGNTTISAGAIRVGPGGVYGSGANTITVQSGATLAGQGTISDSILQQSGSVISPGNVGVNSPDTLTVNSITLNGATLRVDLNAADSTAGSGVNDLIQATGPINVSGTVLVSPTITGGSPVAGTTYTLITGSPWASGDASNFALAPGAPLSVTFDTTTSPGSLLMTVQAGSIAPLVWQGNNGNNWDTTTTNWLNTITALPDKFVNLDPLTFDDTSTNGNVNLVGALSPGSVTFNNSSLNYVLSGSGSIAGFNGVTLNGYATVTLATDNSYTGGTTVNAGTLQLGSGGTNGSVVGDIADNGVLVFNRADTVTHTTVISGGGALVKANTNTLILTAANTYSGGTTVSNGTLQLGAGGAAGSIQGDVVNNGALKVNRSANLTFGGVISGPGSFQQAGTATTILTADQTFTGGVTINSGTLQLGNNGFTGSVIGDVTNNGTLSFNRVDDLVYTNTISGTGNVTKNGSGSFAFTANQPFTGSLTHTAGTLVLTNVNSQSSTTLGASGTMVVGNNGALGSGTLVTVASTSTATLALSNNISILAGKAVTLYSRNNDSVAFLNLSESNTIATSISMNSGGARYRVQSDSGTLAIGGFGGIVNGKTLHLQGNGNGLVYGEVSGAGNLGIEGPGTWVLIGTNTYDNTSVNGGILQIGNGGLGGTLGNGAVTLNAPLVINRAGTYTAANYLTGSGSITNVGSGIVTLSGITNDYTGATVVLGGTLRVNGGLLNSPVSVAAGATLGGTGTIYTPVILEAGSTLAPATATIGMLAVSNDLTIAGNVFFKLRRNQAQSNDLAVVSGLLTNSGTGTIILSNLGPGLVTGDTFRLFSQPLANGSALTISPTVGITWTNRLAWDGTVAVTYAPPLVSTNPPYLTNIVVGGNLNLSWPADHLGWRLEVQTNQLTVGLATNWVTWPGSTTNTSESIPVLPGNPSVFFRLVYP